MSEDIQIKIGHNKYTSLNKSIRFKDLNFILILHVDWIFIYIFVCSTCIKSVKKELITFPFYYQEFLVFCRLINY